MNNRLLRWVVCEFLLIIFCIVSGIITVKLEGDITFPAFFFILMTIANNEAYAEGREL